MGDVLVAQGNLPEARRSYRDGLIIAQRLAASDPGNAGWQRGLAVSYGKIADVAARKGARAEALDGFRRARDIVARLSRESPDNATLQNDLKFYEHQIAQQNGP